LAKQWRSIDSQAVSPLFLWRQFPGTLVLATVAGEEQGLYGSTFMANQKASRPTPPRMTSPPCRPSAARTTASRGNPESNIAGYEVVQRETTVPDWTSAIPVGNVAFPQVAA
jgi:hypothetical protein